MAQPKAQLLFCLTVRIFDLADPPVTYWSFVCGLVHAGCVVTVNPSFVDGKRDMGPLASLSRHSL